MFSKVLRTEGFQQGAFNIWTMVEFKFMRCCKAELQKTTVVDLKKLCKERTEFTRDPFRDGLETTKQEQGIRNLASFSWFYPSILLQLFRGACQLLPVRKLKTSGNKDALVNRLLEAGNCSLHVRRSSREERQSVMKFIQLCDEQQYFQDRLE